MTHAEDLIEAAFPLTPIAYGQYGVSTYPVSLTDDASRPATTRPTPHTAAVAPAPTPRFDAITHGPPITNAPARGTALRMTRSQATIIEWAVANNSGLIPRGGTRHSATSTQLYSMERRGFVVLTYNGPSVAYGTVTSKGELVSGEVLAKRVV